jgi:hypothetical protein
MRTWKKKQVLVKLHVARGAEERPFSVPVGRRRSDEKRRNE